MLDPNKTLNPVLARRLQTTFGEIKLENPGQAFQATAYTEGADKRTRLRFTQRGEYFRANCWNCGDRRFRLYVNHRWGTLDSTGRPMRFLAICFNEDCLADFENRDQFIRYMERVDGASLQSAPIKEGKIDEGPALIHTWPGAVQNLQYLPAYHPACLYLADRGFDPATIGRRYGVGFCVETSYYPARDKLIIPLYVGGMMRGWQARWIKELDWKGADADKPKYWTRGQRSKIIYSFDVMKRYQTGILVEGAIDAWGFGAPAGALLSNRITEAQVALFLGAFRNRTSVVLLDADAVDNGLAAKVQDRLSIGMPGRVALVRLPDGADPGSLDRDFQREYVRQEAAKQGVEVSYERCATTGRSSGNNSCCHRRRMGSGGAGDSAADPPPEAPVGNGEA